MIHVIDAQPGGLNKSGLYQLKITLKGSKPPIWRRVVVPGDMRLNRLHDVIQIAMGWTDSHLHQFVVETRSAPTYFGVPDQDFDYIGSKTLNERRYTVANLAPIPKKKFCRAIRCSNAPFVWPARTPVRQKIAVALTAITTCSKSWTTPSIPTTEI